jgi:FeS assembly SUF system regulator
MLKLAKLTDYALRITDHLVMTTDSLKTNKELSQATQIPIATVRKLLKLLVDAKIIKSFRGSSGGYRLSRPAKDISIAQVIIAIEGPISITECASYQDSCDFSEGCNLKDSWGILNNFFIKTLTNISLAEMSNIISDQLIELDINKVL